MHNRHFFFKVFKKLLIIVLKKVSLIKKYFKNQQKKYIIVQIYKINVKTFKINVYSTDYKWMNNFLNHSHVKNLHLLMYNHNL